MAPHSTFDDSGYMPSNVYFGQGEFKDLLPINKELGGGITLQSGVKPLQPYDRKDDSQGLCLSALEIQEIEQAINFFQRLHLPLNMINPRTFPLPKLSSKLADVSRILAEQTGYFLISGLEPSRYTQWTNTLIHAGMSSYVGNKRAMPGGEGGDKNVLHHIKAMPPNLATKISDYHGPPNQNIAMPFHTDSGEIVSLFTLSPGNGGGRFYLASAAEILDDLQQRRPDLATVLFDDWTMISPSVHESSTRPIFFRMVNGKLVVACSRARITGTPTRPRPKSLPNLTVQQLAALDALHMIGMEVAISFDFQAGDLLFFNNTTTMHARDSFTDADVESEGPKRHLLRLILRDETPTAAGRWTIPRALEDVWKSLYDHEDQEEIFSVKEELFSWATSH